MNKTIGFILLLLLATGSVAESQNTARVGLLLPQSAFSEPDRSRIKAFQQGLAEIGYFEGKNIAVEYRSAEGRLDRLPALAAELVALKVDVIVTGGNESIRAVQNKTSTIPVVMAFGGEPCRERLCGQPGATRRKHHRIDEHQSAVGR